MMTFQLADRIAHPRAILRRAAARPFASLVPHQQIHFAPARLPRRILPEIANRLAATIGPPPSRQQRLSWRGFHRAARLLPATAATYLGASGQHVGRRDPSSLESSYQLLFFQRIAQRHQSSAIRSCGTKVPAVRVIVRQANRV